MSDGEIGFIGSRENSNEILTVSAGELSDFPRENEEQRVSFFVQSRFP